MQVRKQACLDDYNSYTKPTEQAGVNLQISSRSVRLILGSHAPGLFEKDSQAEILVSSAAKRLVYIKPQTPSE